MSTSCESAIILGSLGLGVTGGIIADRITTPSPTPTILKHPENISFQRLDTNGPVDRAWKNLQKPTFAGVDGRNRSFEEIMEATGYKAFAPLSTGPLPLTGTAHKDQGLNVRAYPTTNGVISPILERIKAGEAVFWRGEFPSQNPDGSMDIFGLRVDPNSMSGSLTNPTYIAIRTHHPDGTIEWYVQTANPFVKRLSDGSYDFGNGIIGPSTADQEAANRK